MTKAQENEKHAYLILYHKNSEQLAKLLGVLDDRRNDIYIHADKKTKDFPIEKLQNAVKHAGLFFTKRIKVGWGGYSVIQAMIILLKESTKKQYAYYHLLSGQDLPIKSQEYIFAFFNEFSGTEFIQRGTCLPKRKIALEKIVFYHFFIDYYNRTDSHFAKICRYLENVNLKVQKRLRINRIRGKEKTFFCGSMWFSITQEFAEYCVQQEKWIRKNFKWTLCGDEIFMPTIAVNSCFQSRMHHPMRLIDWDRGSVSHPHIFTGKDFHLLAQSDCLFARKFDMEVDAEIIDRVVNELCRPNSSHSS